MNYPKIQLWLRQKNQDYDITSAVDGVTWGGDYKQAARTLDFGLLYPTNDTQAMKTVVPEVGNMVFFNVDGKEVFRGIVWTVDLSENNQFLQVNCYDIAVYLTKSSLAYNLKNIAPEATAKKVCADLDLPIGSLEAGGMTYNDCALNKTGYDMIMAGYTEAMKKNNNKYMIRADGGKINVIKKGVVKVPIELDSTVNVFNAQFNETLDGMVNKVIVYDDTGTIKHTEENKQWQSAYGILQNAISYNEDEDNVALAKKELKGTTKKCSVEGFGDVRAITGNAITLKVPHTKLVGLFYIDNDSHNWTNETYTMNLTIAFENLMDEVDIQKETEKKSDTDTSSTCAGTLITNHPDANKDWGHGITASMLNAVFKNKLAGQGTLFVQLSNIYKVNPGLMAAIAMHETGNGVSNFIVQKNNCFGMMSSNGGMTFSSLAEGIHAGISNLSRNYVYLGRKSIEDIQKKYAPVGALNDPNGLNKNWVSGLNSFYKKITGTTYSASKSGTGIKDKVSLRFSECSSSNNSNDGDGKTTGNFKWPAPGISRITSPFGPRKSPGGIGSTNHKGIDIGTPSGTTVVASDGGTVIHADSGYNGGYGKLVKIKHDNGYETRYAHLSSILVKNGQKVTKGQTIAKSGNTGNSTGPHLHFEVRKDGVAKNPSNYVKP